MRIISGHYKGRKLSSTKSLHIRPTTDRVKEYIFNVLHDFPMNKTIVDIFSGSGNLGIEAISRGAHKIVFVDNSFESLDILKKNLDALKIPDQNIQIVKSDAIKFVKKNQIPFDLYFLDPPFKYPELQQLLDTLFNTGYINAESIIVLENEISNPINESSKSYDIIKQKKFGRSLINFIIKKENNVN